MRKISIVLLIVLLSSPFYLNIQAVHAEETEPALASAINNALSNIQNTVSPWSVTYGQVFGLRNQSVFDDAILKALSQSDYLNVIFIARLAEINGYSSPVINNSVRTVLQSNTPFTLLTLLYDRYMINAFRYAQQLGVSGWDLSVFYNAFADNYVSNGEDLYINSAQTYVKTRYYDEHAETLEMFLELAKAAGDNYTAYLDDEWLNTQSHWNGQFYIYDAEDTKVNVVECEMGNFAQIISEYRNYRGDIPYFDRVINDLQYKLLDNGFNSPGWGATGVIRHATNNSQLRLGETMGALIALQMLYPNFSPDDQSSFRVMLDNGQAWKGLLSSNLYNNSQFRFTNDDGVPYGDDDSSLGAITLFLYGIVPCTGYLAMNASEERYQDYRTCFPTSQWQFNYQNQTIRIPIMAGNLSFIFGTEEVNQNFPLNGVYDIQFADDWNSIISVKGYGYNLSNITTCNIAAYISTYSNSNTDAITLTNCHSDPCTNPNAKHIAYPVA